MSETTGSRRRLIFAALLLVLFIASPAPIHTLYIEAVAVALHPVFLTAAATMVVAFALAWRLRDVPLRETAAESLESIPRAVAPQSVGAR